MDGGLQGDFPSSCGPQTGLTRKHADLAMLGHLAVRADSSCVCDFVSRLVLTELLLWFVQMDDALRDFVSRLVFIILAL